MVVIFHKSLRIITAHVLGLSQTVQDIVLLILHLSLLFSSFFLHSIYDYGIVNSPINQLRC